MNDENDLDRERRRKVQNFRLKIDGEDGEPGEEPAAPAISSFSDPGKARKSEADGRETAAVEQLRRAHVLRDREKSRKNRRLFRVVWFCMVVMLAVLLSKYLAAGVNDMLAVGRRAVTVTVEIPPDASAGEVTQILYKAGAITDTDFFSLYSKLTKAPKTYGGGSYQITTGLDYEALINAIQSTDKRVDTVKVTFSEGMNAREIAAKLEENGVCTAEEALAAFRTSELDKTYDMLSSITNSSDRYYRLEGYLFPDTYEFFKNEDPVDAAEKLVSNCSDKLTKQIREKAAEEGMTVDQLLTLASLIQAEAADKADMYNISSVFHNRLADTSGSFKHLDSDPTTYYPYRLKADVPEALRETYKSTYDTYTVEGLPTGPICNPGLDAIDAALNPNSTKYFYFCHDAKGNAFYASTESEQNANLKKAGLA